MFPSQPVRELGRRHVRRHAGSLPSQPLCLRRDPEAVALADRSDRLRRLPLRLRQGLWGVNGDLRAGVPLPAQWQALPALRRRRVLGQRARHRGLGGRQQLLEPEPGRCLRFPAARGAEVLVRPVRLQSARPGRTREPGEGRNPVGGDLRREPRPARRRPADRQRQAARLQLHPDSRRLPVRVLEGLLRRRPGPARYAARHCRAGGGA